MKAEKEVKTKKKTMEPEIYYQVKKLLRILDSDKEMIKARNAPKIFPASKTVEAALNNPQSVIQ